MGTTKSLGKKDTNDCFFTKPYIAKKCIDFVVENINDFYDYTIIEPSAGEGAFSEQIEKCISYDINPKKDYIIKKDWINSETDIVNKTIIIGNPPFGQQCSLAIKFINKSITYDNVKFICFILPLSFKKESIQNKIDKRFSILNEFILDKNSFILDGKEYDVPCVFQIWLRKERENNYKKIENNIIEFTTKDRADFRIQRVGGNAGKASKDFNFSESSNYFVKNISSIYTDILIDRKSD